MRSKVISMTLSMLMGILFSFTFLLCFFDKRMEYYKDLNEKQIEFYQLQSHWIKNICMGDTIEKRLKKRGYDSVAIYGMKEIGENLYEELKYSSINVKFVIDRDAECIYKGVPTYHPEDILPDVDAIIVTAIHSYTEIKEVLLKNNSESTVVAIGELVF